MKQYNVIQAIYLSFYSRDFYRDVATWGAKSFLYLFILLALAWIGSAFLIQQAFNRWYARDANAIVAQIPILTIKAGKVSTPENHPYFINNPDTHERIAIIDVTGQYSTLDQAKTPLLVTQDSVLSQSNQNEVKIYKIDNNVNMVINPTLVNERMQEYKGFLWLPFYILLLLGSYIYRLIQALLYALIGKIITLITDVSLTYGQLIQIAMVAVTPPIILACFFDFFNITFPFINGCYFILAMFYLCFGIRANKNRIN